MKLEVLVSTMNLNNHEQLLRKLNIKCSSVIINQITKDERTDINITKGENRIYSYHEKGLSKSRNKAIENSQADICVIADDDLTYVDNYEDIIIDAYKKYKDADIIVFYVDGGDIHTKKKKLKQGRLNYITSLKVQSVQMTFKRKNVIENNISFDESFGAGTENYMGEENIFLYDCLREGLKIYSVPIKIATLNDGESTWFNGFDEKYFRVKGKCFNRMSKRFSWILKIQFLIRKYNLYKRNYTISDCYNFLMNR